MLVIDKRNHIAGNVYTENIEEINVHKYGAHIFHTDYKDVWDYVNSFSDFSDVFIILSSIFSLFTNRRKYAHLL